MGYTTLFQAYNWEKSNFFSQFINVFAQIYAISFHYLGNFADLVDLFRKVNVIFPDTHK